MDARDPQSRHRPHPELRHGRRNEQHDRGQRAAPDPGAVSQQIKRLEDAFACPLFERDRRGLILTNAGERRLGKARHLLGLNDEIWAEITTPAFTGEVRLGMPCDLVTTYLPPILKTYAQEYPQVEVSLVCLDSPLLAQVLAAGEIDLAIIEEPAGRSDGECLAIERLAWVGGQGGRGLSEASAAALDRQRHLRVSPDRVRRLASLRLA